MDLGALGAALCRGSFKAPGRRLPHTQPGVSEPSARGPGWTRCKVHGEGPLPALASSSEKAGQEGEDSDNPKDTSSDASSGPTMPQASGPVLPLFGLSFLSWHTANPCHCHAVKVTQDDNVIVL